MCGANQCDAQSPVLVNTIMVFGLGKKDKKGKKGGEPNKSDSKTDDKSNPANGDDLLGDLFNFSATPDAAEKGDGKETDGKEAEGKAGKKEKKDSKDKKEEEVFGNGGGVLEDVDAACTLSWKARLAGFIVCFLVSVVLVGLGYLFIVLRKIPAFAVVYSIGAIVAILSTGFLVGPMKQFKVMMEKGRIVATIIYVAAIIVTIVVGVKKMLIPAIICMVLQVLAFIFYSLTFMPFVGRYIKRKCSIKMPKVW